MDAADEAPGELAGGPVGEDLGELSGAGAGADLVDEGADLLGGGLAEGVGEELLEVEHLGARAADDLHHQVVLTPGVGGRQDVVEEEPLELVLGHPLDLEAWSVDQDLVQRRDLTKHTYTHITRDSTGAPPWGA